MLCWPFTPPPRRIRLTCIRSLVTIKSSYCIQTQWGMCFVLTQNLNLQRFFLGRLHVLSQHRDMGNGGKMSLHLCAYSCRIPWPWSSYFILFLPMVLRSSHAGILSVPRQRRSGLHHSIATSKRIILPGNRVSKVSQKYKTSLVRMVISFMAKAIQE